MKLSEYLDGMRSATTADELEAAIQAPYKHSFRGRTWSQICRVRIETGKRIVAAHPLGKYVPQFGPHRLLTVCGETYKVGRGQNSTGVRYAWEYARIWARSVLKQQGFSTRVAHRICDNDWSDYPHRSLNTVADALAGKFPDPELNVLHRYRSSAGPIKYSIERNNADRWDYRANRPCECGGTLFDWGGGHSEGFEFINWHCNACPDVFTEYMTREQFYELRRRKD